MPIEKKPGDYAGVRLTVEHRGPAARPWWGFGFIKRGRTGADFWGGAYHDIPAHADWTPVSYTFSFKVHTDVIPGDIYGCFAGLWPTAWKGYVYESSLITLRKEDVYQIAGVPVPAPHISSLSPSPCAIGAVLEIRGSNFSPTRMENKVWFKKGVTEVSVIPSEASASLLTVDLSVSATLSNPANAGLWGVSVERIPDGAVSNSVFLSLTAPAPGTAEYRALQAEAWSAQIRRWEGYGR